MQEKWRQMMGTSATTTATLTFEQQELQSRNKIELKQSNPYIEQLQLLEAKIDLLIKQFEAKENEKLQINVKIKEYLRNGKESLATVLLRKKNTIDSDITMITTTISKYEETASNLRKIVLIDDTKKTVRETNQKIQKFIQTSENGDDDLTDIIYDDKFNSASIDKMSTMFNVSYGDSLTNGAKETQDELAKMKLELEQEDNYQLNESMPQTNAQRQQQQQVANKTTSQQRRPSILDEFGM
jgi:hypothetical protein